MTPRPFPRSKPIPSWMIVRAVAAFVVFATSVAAQANPRPLPAGPSAPVTQAAPGYCPSTGGSTQFEAVTAVTLTRRPGNILRVKVDVFIANPTGCTAGNPCPEYDNSPEFVNAWIDWNGNGVWEAPEKVLDQAGSGYLNINYRGTMTFLQDVSIPPNAVAVTWLRANLGWSHDPNDPCEIAWDWGNVFDREVRLEQVAVLSIAASGTETPIQGVTDPVWQTSFGPAPACALNAPSKNEPVAGGFHGSGPKLDVTLGACPAVPSYTPRVEYEWMVPSTGVPCANQKGQGSFTGWTGMIPLTLPCAVGKSTVELKFDIFDDRNDKVRSNQTATLTVYVGYEKARAPNATPKKVWLDKGTTWASGGKDPEDIGTRLVGGIYGNGGWEYIDPAVSWKGLVEGTGTRGNCYTMSDMWNAMGQILGVPGTNVRETKGTHTQGFVTKPGKNVSFDPMQRGNAHAQGAAIDRWFFGAHQVGTLGAKYYDPTFNNNFSPLLDFILWNCTGGWAVDAIGYYKPAEGAHKVYLKSGAAPWGDFEFRPPTAPMPPPTLAGAGVLTAGFDGPVAWATVDDDGDGQAEALRVSGNIRVDGPPGVYENFSWVGNVGAGGTPITSRSSSGSMLPAGGALASVGVGTYPFELDFSGQDILASGLDGPYSAELFLAGGDGTPQDSRTGLSPAYANEAFGEAPARLQSAADLGVDTNANSLFDELAVDVTFDAAVAGTVGLSVAASVPGDSVPLVQAGASGAVSAGTTTVRVALDGRPIRARGVDGPYDLAIQLLDGGGFVLETRTPSSAAYLAADFEPPVLAVSGGASDAGEDDDGNGRFERLVVMVPVTTTQAGTYQSSAQLSAGGTVVATASELATLPAGPALLELPFPGTDIEAGGLDGPYDVVSFQITGPDGALAYETGTLHTTTVAYAASDFEAALTPLATLTGTYASTADDTTGDGKHDVLRFSVEAVAAQDGNLVASAFLRAGSGELIEWASGFAPATAGIPVTIEVPFSGRRIYGRGADGPYQVRGLLVYHTGDPERSAEADSVHQSAAYAATDFAPAPRVVGNVHESGGAPVADALVYLNPPDDYDFTDAAGDYHLMVGGEGGNLVEVRLQSVPGHDDAGWRVFVDGVDQGLSTSAFVAPGLGQDVEVEFVYESLVAVEPRPAPGRAWLAAAAPNPGRVGSGVRLRYGLPAGTEASAAVFDVQGRLVRRLSVGPAGSVEGELFWDGRDDAGRALPARLYLIRLEVRDARGQVTSLVRKAALLE